MTELKNDFAGNQAEFDARFPTEESCRAFLFQLRWPDGFRCPYCDASKGWSLRGERVECSGCAKQVSVTSGTILHKTRKPLRTWFQAMWWICTQKTGGSAKGLQRLLGLGSYETAWTWLHKIRRAMILAEREPLERLVEVDDAYIGGEEAGARGRQSFKKAALAVAVEVPGPKKRGVGRIRLLHVPDFSAGALLPFVCENVQEGSHIVTDGWDGYAKLKAAGYRHEVRLGGAELLPHVHLVISLLKRWLLGTHQGAVRPKQLQYYLEEFTFRFNRRKSQRAGKIFYRMLQGVGASDPLTYRAIADRPAKPDYVPYNI